MAKALMLALMPKGKMTGKGKGMLKDTPAPESDDEPEDTGEDMHEEHKQLFVDAAKDGDWEAAFDALMACMGNE